MMAKVFPFHIFLAAVSFDYDGVLSTKKGKEMAKNHLTQGDKVYIITARQKTDSSAVYSTAAELGIPRSQVVFTEGRDKWTYVKRRKMDIHYDNNPEQIQKINDKTMTRGRLFK